MSSEPMMLARAALSFLSSGDLLADRRYEWAMALRDEGDLAGAADLFEQAVEKAPAFACAWFALGETCEVLDRRDAAIAAFHAARGADPADRLGAGLRLARLGAAPIESAMPGGYVRALFDQYAPTFDDALVNRLGYRAPALLFDAVDRACRALDRPARFSRVLDLGCGTGLAGRAFRPLAASLAGVDLSPAMLEKARQTGVYDDLRTGEMLEWLRAEDGASADLVVAADALVYVADLGPIFQEAARALAARGLLAFTLEIHEGEDVILRDTLRFAHGPSHVRSALAKAELSPVILDGASTRTEKGAPVPGLIVVAVR